MNTFSSARQIHSSTIPAGGGSDDATRHGHPLVTRRLNLRGVMAGTLMMTSWLAVSVLQPRPLEAATAAPCLDSVQYQWVNCVFQAPDAWSVTLCDLAYFVGYAICLRENPA